MLVKYIWKSYFDKASSDDSEVLQEVSSWNVFLLSQLQNHNILRDWEI